MNSIRRRGSAAPKPRTRGTTFGVALVAALILSLATAISASAAGSGASPGVGGTGFSTVTDTTPQSDTQPAGYQAPANDGLGVAPGQIKHVWVITLENHAYDASFTGSNANSYLWQTLPQDGALLTNYFATGHSSEDNYLTSVSGQAPLPDDQNDCPAYTQAQGSVDTTQGSLAKNANYGQFTSSLGPEAPADDNGCVYPNTVPTLFNQLDAASKSWKLYGQDIAYPGDVGTNYGNQNAGTQYCGAPDTTEGTAPNATQASNIDGKSTAASGAGFNPVYDYGSATPTSGYVAKHNPLPWFDAVNQSGDCTAGLTGGQYGNSTHIGELFGANDTLYNDLQSESTTPAFSIIQPNNCSDGHDAVCTNNSTGANATNNLSGGFGGPNGQTPNPSLNSVGGLYAADLFLGHVIPEIQNSPAYADGGLIIVNFDEAYPPFTYSSDSFTDSSTQAPTAAATVANIDSAGETLFGRSVSWEPSGPNTPSIVSATGQQMSAGAGFNEYLDRPDGSVAPLAACTSGATPNNNGYQILPSGGCYLGGGKEGTTARNAVSSSGTTLSLSTAADGGTLVTQTATSPGALFSPLEQGEPVTLTNATTTATAYLGKVTANLPTALGKAPENTNPANGTVAAGGTADSTGADQSSSAQFELYDVNGNPLTVTPTGGTVTLATAGETAATDPLYDAFDATTGGGDTGAVLLSPYIKGGTVSNNYYNHYSLLRTLEDIFQVSSGSGSAAGYKGAINVSTGVDGLGHLGYAAQAGLAPFGPDVFTGVNNTTTTTVTSTISKTVTAAAQAITVPGSPYAVTVRSNYALVPDVKGDSYSTGHKILNRGSFHLGSVHGSTKAKKGYTIEIATQSPKPLVYEQAGSKVSLDLKYVKTKK